MNQSKDTEKSPSQEDMTADEIARALLLATQICDGAGLSDEDLEVLCDAVLSEPKITPKR